MSLFSVLSAIENMVMPVTCALVSVFSSLTGAHHKYGAGKG